MSEVVRYDMPAGFGPSLMPSQTKVENATAAIISFETDTTSLTSLMPRHRGRNFPSGLNWFPNCP
jgi:hypothetical protein